MTASQVVDTNLANKRRPRARQSDRDGFITNGQPSHLTVDGKRIPMPHHDVLVVAPEGVHQGQQFYRFPVVKNPRDGEQLGEYKDPPELLDAHDLAQRKVISFSRPQDWGHGAGQGGEPWGPAFATLPVKPEPAATSCATCFLINTQNMNFINPWTAEEWTDDPGPPDLPAALGSENTQFEALLAGPRGVVFHVSFDGIDQWDLDAQAIARSKGASATVRRVNLQEEMETWNQLRNGCVAGRVRLRDSQGRGVRVVPLVNITTLTPTRPRQGQQA